MLPALLKTQGSLWNFIEQEKLEESVLTQAFLFSGVLICFTCTLSENEIRDASSSNRLSDHFHGETRGPVVRAAAQCVTGGVHEAGFFAHL